jgi:hypothetical protein
MTKLLAAGLVAFTLALTTIPIFAADAGFKLLIECAESNPDFIGEGTATIGDESFSFTCTQESPSITLMAVPSGKLSWLVIVTFVVLGQEVALFSGAGDPGTCVGGQGTDNAGGRYAIVIGQRGVIERCGDPTLD